MLLACWDVWYQTLWWEQPDVNRTAHRDRPCRVRLPWYSTHRKFTLGWKARFLLPGAHVYPLQTSFTSWELQWSISPWPTQRMRLWFIHTTAGKLGIVFTEFFTSSSVTSTTEQCSSSSGSGSSPPLVSHGCTCMGKNKGSCSSAFYSKMLRCWWWDRNRGTGLITGQAVGTAPTTASPWNTGSMLTAPQSPWQCRFFWGFAEDNPVFE